MEIAFAGPRGLSLDAAQPAPGLVLAFMVGSIELRFVASQRYSLLYRQVYRAMFLSAGVHASPNPVLGDNYL